MNMLHTARFIIMSLVFSILLYGCRDDKPGNSEEIQILWENNKAVMLVIPKKLLRSDPEFTDIQMVQVYLAAGNGQAILGDKEDKISSGYVVFKPLIPFTRGLKYKVTNGKRTVGRIEIPPASSADASKVVTIYPTRDTVPVNLLKIYIAFSKPMRQGESLQHIVFIKNGTDTLEGTFLDLQPELWNNERTVLTLWLDPGRIKRGLQPNLAMGPPLSRDNNYTLIVKQDWKNEEGVELQRNFIKNFVTIGYDSLLLDPGKWKIKIPGAGTNNSVDIDFYRSLDYMLVRNAVHIKDITGMDVPGVLSAHPGEIGCSFTPAEPWQKGNYFLFVEPRLEDLAGNNLDHLFDNDLTHKASGTNGKGYRRSFQVK